MASYDERIADLKRKLFRSPVVDMVDAERSPETSNGNALLSRLELEQDVIEVGHKMLQRDLHEQRLKHLRQKLKGLAEDDWRYDKVDKLIGLQ